VNGSTSPVDTLADRLQEGIYFRSGERPGPCYRLLLLNVRPGATPADAGRAIDAVWDMLQDLRRGLVRDLRPMRPSDPEVNVPDGRLTCLLGFGARLFDPDLHVPRLVNPDVRPWELVALRRPGSPFPSLPWATEGEQKPGEADLAIQCIAETELAVNLAVVEVWKLIVDQDLPLEVATFHDGFGRADGRSWIDFHDGVNNMEAGEERRSAIEAVIADPPWMEGGTYMSFLRLAVDLASWRRLPREHQEILVGRDKLTGCPLERVDRGQDGELVPVALDGCPVSGAASGSLRPEDRDPPRPGDPLVQASHIHRSNRNRGRPDTPANNRIFRQGYEFLEAITEGGFRLGLNFVSFQRNLKRLRDSLGLKDWLGDVNFGGPVRPKPGEPAPITLISVIAGGFYAVPPKGAPFPGAKIF
jgi:deferrochelatase/peroxidase EfeB